MWDPKLKWGSLKIPPIKPEEGSSATIVSRALK